MFQVKQFYGTLYVESKNMYLDPIASRIIAPLSFHYKCRRSDTSDQISCARQLEQSGCNNPLQTMLQRKLESKLFFLQFFTLLRHFCNVFKIYIADVNINFPQGILVRFPKKVRRVRRMQIPWAKKLRRSLAPLNVCIVCM